MRSLLPSAISPFVPTSRYSWSAGEAAMSEMWRPAVTSPPTYPATAGARYARTGGSSQSCGCHRLHSFPKSAKGAKGKVPIGFGSRPAAKCSMTVLPATATRSRSCQPTLCPALSPRAASASSSPPRREEQRASNPSAAEAAAMRATTSPPNATWGFTLPTLATMSRESRSTRCSASVVVPTSTASPRRRSLSPCVAGPEAVVASLPATGKVPRSSGRTSMPAATFVRQARR